MKILIDLEFDSDANIEEQLQEVTDYIEDSLASSAISCKVLSKAEEAQNISDGYHSFKELYDHRIQLFIALLNNLNPDFYWGQAWKSKKHSDGTEWDGWFIAGLFTEEGRQITYHLPIDKWDELKIQELPQAPEYDGHSPADVLERLKSL